MCKSSNHIFIKIGFVFTYRIVSIIYFRPGHVTIPFQVFISASRIRTNHNITPQIFGQLVYFSCVKVYRICEISPISCGDVVVMFSGMNLFIVALLRAFFIRHDNEFLGRPQSETYIFQFLIILTRTKSIIHIQTEILVLTRSKSTSMLTIPLLCVVALESLN